MTERVKLLICDNCYWSCGHKYSNVRTALECQCKCHKEPAVTPEIKPLNEQELIALGSHDASKEDTLTLRFFATIRSDRQTIAQLQERVSTLEGELESAQIELSQHDRTFTEIKERLP